MKRAGGKMPKMSSSSKGSSSNFIKGAIKRPGALHQKLGVPQGQKIPAAKVAAAAKKPGLLGKEARFAQFLKKVGKKK